MLSDSVVWKWRFGSVEVVFLVAWKWCLFWGCGSGVLVAWKWCFWWRGSGVCFGGVEVVFWWRGSGVLVAWKWCFSGVEAAFRWLVNMSRCDLCWRLA